jgi:hypothetical protein
MIYQRDRWKEVVVVVRRREYGRGMIAHLMDPELMP